MKIIYISPYYLLLSTLRLANANPAELEIMLAKIEQDTYKFAQKMEELILDRCQFTSDATCYQMSYHTCDSELPSATCPGKDLAIQKCGSGREGGCGGLFDYTTSVVSVAPDNSNSAFYENQEANNDRIKDGVCSTLRVEQYMKQLTSDASSYWSNFDVAPPALYYGTDDGVFRIFPGSPGSCPNGMNTYDPRVRPWYIAASSGPKDVILVLDTSGSMKHYGRMEIMQEAAQRVINTLGVSDYFAVIEFNTEANIIGDDYLMLRATDENKLEMLNRINSLTAVGGTNFYNGFELAFRTIDESILRDRSSGCRRAILFLSDGELMDDASKLKLHISSEREKYITKGKEAPVLFTYSFGEGAANSPIPKEIACENGGIWAKIGDGGDLSKSMGAYYKYFAYGLGDKANENFVAWVEPYEFSTGVGLGTTAAAPVYDRSVVPPVLAGVVGMDINFAALQRAFGNVGNSESVLIERLVKRSGAVCPKLNITKCQLESLRVYGSGDYINTDASCSQCSSPIQALKAPLCDYYPDQLWDNRLNKWRTFEERTCCSVGSDPRTKNSLTDEEIRNGVCTEERSSAGIAFIIGGVVVSVIVALGGYLLVRRRGQSKKPQSVPHSNPNHSITAYVVQQPVQSPFFPVQTSENDIVVLPPPTAPDEIITIASPVPAT